MAAQSRTEEISFAQHASYICSRLLAYGLPLLFFLVTSTFYLKTYDSAQIKITITQVGTVFLLFVWVARMLINGRLPFTRADLVYIAPFLAFLISGMVVWLHSPFKAWSSEETSRRIFYMVLALIGIAEINTNERKKRLWRWLIAAAWVSIGYGVMQYIDWRFFPGPTGTIDPFIWRGAFGARIFSTFGNPNFYGNFLVIVTPLIFASVLRENGSLMRMTGALLLTLMLVVVIDKTTLGLFGGADNSMQLVYSVFILTALGLLFYTSFWNIGSSKNLPMFVLLFSCLFLNLYGTETKGAWVGFLAAIGGTLWLIFENFLHFEDDLIEPKKYFAFLMGLTGAFTLLLALMAIAFVKPLFDGGYHQTGFQILWIPTLIAAIVAVALLLWLFRKPWNMKKVIYGVLLFCMIAMGAGVLNFAQRRLVSVSFRLFTWISTWEMVHTNPVLGNGVGTFKIIYPAFRRPQIIVLEAKSNTETDHAEDEYLEVWQDEGIVGFGIFLWMVITALVVGFKQLRWYSRLHPHDPAHKKKLTEIKNDPHSYEVLGFLGAYIGALIHWLFDVSVRFVSSGIFSGLLPGMLVSYARNQDKPVVDEPRLWYDRWIRAGLALAWVMIFCWLRLELVPNSMIQGGYTTPAQIYTWIFLAGAALLVLIELLEIGNAPATPTPLSSYYETPSQKAWMFRVAALPVVAVALGYGGLYFANQFFGDVHHNLAIFFSKEAIWTKSPIYDAKLMNYPQDIREKYQNTGGALEHYEMVNKMNHAFPMAYYFTGNVYNDWGSQDHQESANARAHNNMDEALRFRAKSIDKWNKSEAAYENTKKLAPNYVQTHHQIGLLWVKRAEQAAFWGDQAESRRCYQEALSHFRQYKMLDPVFIPNYDRIVQILLMDGKVDESIALYKEALYYNNDVAREIHTNNFPDRTAAIALSLAKLYYNQVANKTNIFNPPAEQVTEAIKYFKMAADNDPKNVEAWKGLGYLLERTGQHAASQEAFHHVLSLSPNDPDVRPQSQVPVKR